MVTDQYDVLINVPSTNLELSIKCFIWSFKMLCFLFIGFPFIAIGMFLDFGSCPEFVCL